MLFIMLICHLPTGFLEGLTATFRPTSILPDNVSEENKALRVVKQPLEAAFPGLGYKRVSIYSVRVSFQTFERRPWSVRGSSRNPMTWESRETLTRCLLSFSPSQSASRHDMRNRGRPSSSSRLRIRSKGVRASEEPARISSRPSMNSVLSLHSVRLLQIEGQKISGGYR